MQAEASHSKPLQQVFLYEGAVCGGRKRQEGRGRALLVSHGDGNDEELLDTDRLEAKCVP